VERRGGGKRGERREGKGVGRWGDVGCGRGERREEEGGGRGRRREGEGGGGRRREGGGGGEEGIEGEDGGENGGGEDEVVGSVRGGGWKKVLCTTLSSWSIKEGFLGNGLDKENPKHRTYNQ